MNWNERLLREIERMPRRKQSKPLPLRGDLPRKVVAKFERNLRRGSR